MIALVVLGCGRTQPNKPEVVVQAAAQSVADDVASDNRIVDERDSGSASEPRSPLQEIGDTYRSGHPDKAREFARRRASRLFQSIELGKDRQMRMIGQEMLTLVGATVSHFERELVSSTGSPPDEAAKKCVLQCIEDVDRGYKLLEGEIAKTPLTDRESSIVREYQRLRRSMLTDWILMNRPGDRESIYSCYEAFLKSQGIRSVDLVAGERSVNKCDSIKSSEQHSLTEGLISVYGKGTPEESRKFAQRQSLRFFEAIEQGKDRESRLVGLELLTLTGCLVSHFENELAASTGKADEAAKKCVLQCIEDVDRGYKLLEGEIAKTPLTDRESSIVREYQRYRKGMLVNWIVLNPRPDREAIYRRYEPFLALHGIRFADVSTADLPKPKPPVNAALLKDAKGNREAIGVAINQYCQALCASDQKALRAAISRRISDNVVSQRLQRWRGLMMENKIDRVASLDFGTAIIEVEAATGQDVRVNVDGIKENLVVDGEVWAGSNKLSIIASKLSIGASKLSISNRENVFVVTKEEGRWVICD